MALMSSSLLPFPIDSLFVSFLSQSLCRFGVSFFFWTDDELRELEKEEICDALILVSDIASNRSLNSSTN